MTKQDMTHAPGLRKTDADAPKPARRRFRPRAPVVAMVSHVSQRNVEAVFGIDDRRYLDLLRDHADELSVSNVGKLRVVAVEDLRDVLARLAVKASPHTRVSADAVDADDEQPTTADEVLARLGRRRTG